MTIVRARKMAQSLTSPCICTHTHTHYRSPLTCGTQSSSPTKTSPTVLYVDG